MYAVFSTGGKQYRATTGDIIKVEKLDAEKGATIELDHGYVEASTEGLKGAEIYFDISTVTGTENLMMAAVMATDKSPLMFDSKLGVVINQSESGLSVLLLFDAVIDYFFYFIRCKPAAGFSR